MASPPTVPDRNMLAGRIQGFGNVNPPPLEDETGSTIAKRAVSRLGDMVGEEVMLTVEDFREKGAVGAVKDAVADAGDILIDGVSGLIGWIRGDAPPEEEGEKTEDATKALSNGPSGAAYGISQASPTGGINAVWVMPEDADPQALAQLAAQQGSLVHQQADPRVPKNIQPYQPPAKSLPSPHIPMQAPLQLPGGPAIAPYQPAPSGPGARPPPFVPGGNLTPGFQQSRWGPGGYNPAATPGGAGSSGSASSAPTGAKGLVERIAKGDVLMGPDVAKRLVNQCTAAKLTGKQLSEIVCERSRRLYLGLDGGDQSDADASLGRMLGLVDALAQQPGDFAKSAVQDIKKSVHEEFLSLRSSAKHRGEAEPMLRRLGLIEKTADVDLLGSGAGGGGGSSAPAASAPAQTADLLGGAVPVVSAAAALGPAATDLLGGASTPAAPSGVAALDPLLGPAAPPVSAGSSSLLHGLAGLDVPTAPAPSPTGGTGMPGLASASPGMAAPAMSSAGAAALASLSAPPKKEEDAFSFVGAELSKASGKP